MKKRTLLVSTAILLVAVMALATASFAWFTAGTTAKAQGMQIKTTVGTSLLISGGDDGGNYSSVGTTTVNTNNVLIPVTSSNGQDFAKLASTVKVENAGNYAASFTRTGGDLDANQLIDVVSGDKYRIQGAYSLKNTGSTGLDVKVSSVTVTADDGVTDTLKTAIRVAIQVGDNYYLYQPTGGSATELGQKTAGTWNLVSASGIYKDSSFAIISNFTGTQSITIYAWIEGQDNACTTDSATALSTNGLSVNVEFIGSEHVGG